MSSTDSLTNHRQSFLARRRPNFLGDHCPNPPPANNHTSFLNRFLVHPFQMSWKGPVVDRPSTFPLSLLPPCFPSLPLEGLRYYFPLETTLLLPHNETLLPLRDHLYATFKFVKSIGLLGPIYVISPPYFTHLVDAPIYHINSLQ
jgi:hypothetical protein